MNQSKYPVEKILQILSEAELPDSSIASVCRKYSISRTTFDKWRQKFKGFCTNEAKRLKSLEEENLRLKKILADKELEIQVLRDVIKKNFNYS